MPGISYSRFTTIKIEKNKFIFFMAICFGFIFNIPLIIKFYYLTKGASFIYTAPLLLTSLFYIIFKIIAIPYITKPIFIFLVLTSSLASYAQLKYQVIFDYSMIENIIETNTAEISSYISLSSSFYFLLFGVIPAFFIYKIEFISTQSLVQKLIKNIIGFIGAIVVIFIIYLSSYKSYAAVGRNNSYLNNYIVPAHVYHLYKYIKINYFTKKLNYKELGEDAVIAPSISKKPTLMVFVLGETASGLHYPVNGYQRNTNPYTKNLNLISIPHVASCATATAGSLPCMFSKITRKKYSKSMANSQSNLLDILQKAGVMIWWLDNDGGDKKVASAVKYNILSASAKYKVSRSILDGAFIEKIEPMISFLENNQAINLDYKQSNAKKTTNKLLVFHLQGSHGPTYFQRYPAFAKKFKPTCERSDIENCSDIAIRNTYDNTIVYTDWVISQLIKKLKTYESKYNVALVYISDHGESLGENGVYLHGTPYMIAPIAQRVVPWQMWLPEQYLKSKNIDLGKLRSNIRTSSISHDNLFSTILALYGVKTKEIESKLNLFN